MENRSTQAEILDRLHAEYARFQSSLRCLTDEQMIHPCTIRDWSVKDLLAHLIAHEQRALQELRMALGGERLVIDHTAVDAFNDGAVMASRSYPIELVYRSPSGLTSRTRSATSSWPFATFGGRPLSVLGGNTSAIENPRAQEIRTGLTIHLPLQEF